MLHSALCARLRDSCTSHAGYKSLRSLTTRSLISSLDLCRLGPSDFLSPAGKFTATIRHKKFNQISKIYFKLKRENGVLTKIPFPQNAHGFLYFHPGPAHAPIAGGVRFRVVPSKDPGKFDCGHDLLSHNLCLPWSIPLPTLFVRQTYAAFASLLLEHDYLAPLVSSIAAGLKEEKIPRTKASVTIVHSLGQHLHADVSRTHFHFRIAKRGILDSHFHFRPFTDQRGEDKHARQHTPYTGSILYTLERGVDNDNDNDKVCCYVRVLDIMKPIIAKDSHYDGHLPPPVKGELLRGAGGRLIKIRKPDLVNLPILPEPL